MTTLEIGKKLVALCNEGKNMEVLETLYSSDIESVEAMEMPGMARTMNGIEAIRGKNQWWYENHTIHGGLTSGPYPHGDRFVVHMKYDVTPKQTGQRMTIEEVGLYTVKDGKIVKEEFFYDMDS